jgi:hypothetical protein
MGSPGSVDDAPFALGADVSGLGRFRTGLFACTSGFTFGLRRIMFLGRVPFGVVLAGPEGDALIVRDGSADEDPTLWPLALVERIWAAAGTASFEVLSVMV